MDERQLDALLRVERPRVAPAEGGPECFGPLQVAAFVRGEQACPRLDHLRGGEGAPGCRHCRMLVRAVARTEAEEALSATQRLAILAAAVRLVPDDPVLQSCLLEAQGAVATELGQDRPPAPGALPASRRLLASLRKRPLLLAAALAILAAGAGVTVRHGVPGRAVARPLQAWMTRVSHGAAGSTGIARVRGPKGREVEWAMAGLRAATAFDPDGTGRQRSLVALGVNDPGQGPGGVLQIRDPRFPLSDRRSLLDSLPLVPADMVPYGGAGRESWRWYAGQILTLAHAGGQDLLVSAVASGSLANAFVRLRWTGDGLQRRAAYFHAGFVRYSEPVEAGGRTLICLRGANKGAPLSDVGWPGRYLAVAGVLDLSRFDDGVWQDPACAGALGAAPPSGLELSYVFFAPVPGFRHGEPDEPRWQAGVGARPGAWRIQCDRRQYLLHADGQVTFSLVTDEARRLDGPAAPELLEQFMGGCQQQAVTVKRFASGKQFREWRDRWFREVYLPAVDAWKPSALAAAEDDLLRPEFQDRLKADLTQIEEATRALR